MRRPCVEVEKKGEEEKKKAKAKAEGEITVRYILEVADARRRMFKARRQAADRWAKLRGREARREGEDAIVRRRGKRYPTSEGGGVGTNGRKHDAVKRRCGTGRRWRFSRGR